jgi:hypothetical protein
LFYEARFSTHPMGPGHRDEAERALSEIASTVIRLQAEEAARARAAEPAGATGSAAASGQAGTR